MSNTDDNPFPTVLVMVLLVILAAIGLGGLAMAGAMRDGPRHTDAVDNGTWHDGMMDGRHHEDSGWVIVPVAIGLLVIVGLLWALWPSKGPVQQMPPYRPPAPHAPVQQPIAPQPYPMQSPPRPPAPQQPPRKDAAVDILEERLAKGEISEKDYLSTLETLKKGRSG